jgi:DNA-binding transcriptional ArsR family regulator
MDKIIQKIPLSEFAAIAEQIEEALVAHDRTSMDRLQSKLENLLVDTLKSAPTAAAAAVRGSAHQDSPEVFAYVLGQLSFGQAVVAQAAERRADNGFLQMLHSAKYAKYVEVLAKDDLNGKQLAELTGETVETVSRKLKELRAAGAVDFRREGTSNLNFLTAAAKSCSHSSESFAVFDAVIKRRADDLVPHMRTLPYFSPDDHPDTQSATADV